MKKHISTIQMNNTLESKYMIRRFSYYHIDLFFKVEVWRYNLPKKVEQRLESQTNNYMIAIF